jgi:type VI secretion system protein ImpJ
VIPGVLWREGMLLAPQHLQHADRAAADRLATALRLATPLAHGVARLSVDAAALAAGSFALLALEAMLPDGTAVRTADAAELPPAIDLATRFPTGQQRSVVYLALALEPPGAISVGADGLHAGRAVRWRPQAAEVSDVLDGRPRPIELVQPNLRLVLDGESLDGLSSLPVAMLVRDGADRFALDPAFAPPCLRLDAASALAEAVRRTTALAAARLAEIGGHRRSRAQGLVEFAVGDVASVMTLQAIGGALPGLAQAVTAGWVHPAEVHARLCALAGQLMALSGDGDPSELPDYDHHRPGPGFAALEARLSSLLRTVTASRYVPVPVRAHSERIHAAQLPDQITAGARIYLALVSALPAERVIRDMPARGKVASHGRLDTLVASAMPGIRLAYQPVPPAEIPVQPGGTYFLLEAHGSEWDLAMKTRTLAVFLPPELAQARVEFLAIREHA